MTDIPRALFAPRGMFGRVEDVPAYAWSLVILLASVTVLAKTAMRADALSTALMVMGPKDGFALAQENDIAAFFIAKTKTGFTETATEPFLRHLIA